MGLALGSFIIVMILALLQADVIEFGGMTGVGLPSTLSYYNNFSNFTDINYSSSPEISAPFTICNFEDNLTKSDWSEDYNDGTNLWDASNEHSFNDTGTGNAFYLSFDTLSSGTCSEALTSIIKRTYGRTSLMDLRGINYIEIYYESSGTCDVHVDAGNSASTKFKLRITDGSDYVDLKSYDILTNCNVGATDSDTHAINISMRKNGTSFVINENGTNEYSVDISSLNSGSTWVFDFYDYIVVQTASIPGCSASATQETKIYSITFPESGFGLNKSKGVFTSNGTLNSKMITQLSSNVTRILLQAQERKPSGTDVNYSISINGSYYYNIIKDVPYYFSGVGDYVYWRAYMTTDDNKTSPLVSVINLTVEPYNCTGNNQCPDIEHCNGSYYCVSDLLESGDCGNVNLSTNYTEMRGACVSGSCAIETTDDYDGGNDYFLCRANNITQCIHNNSLFVKYGESGGYTCSINDSNTGNWSICWTNDVCIDGTYCNQDGTCNDDITHGGECNMSVVKNDTQLNDSCTSPQICYGNTTTTHWCDLQPNVFASSLLTNDTFVGLNHRVVNWTAGTDPDGDTLDYYVTVGSAVNGTDYGTGWTVDNTTVINLTSLDLVQTYYYSVLVCDQYGWCMNSSQPINGNTTRNNSRPNPPTNPIPSNLSSSQLAVTFTWTTGTDTEIGQDTSYDADRDYFCIRDDFNYTDPCVLANYTDSKSISDDNSITIDIPDVAENITYYWFMRTDDGSLNSSWVFFVVQLNVTDINVDLSSGVTSIIFYPNTSTAQQVEPECQTSELGCINVTNRRGYYINISISTNVTYPLSYREGDTNWDFESNVTDGNMSLWNSSFTLSLRNRSDSSDNIWALNVSY